MTKQTAPWIYMFIYDLQLYLNVKSPVPTDVSRPFTTSSVFCREMRHHACQHFFFFGTVHGYSDPEFAVVTLEKLLHSLSVKREVHFLWQPGKLAQGKSKGGSSERGWQVHWKRTVHKHAEKAFLGLFTTLENKLTNLCLCWKVRWSIYGNAICNRLLPWLWKKNTQTYMCVLHVSTMHYG